jgi:hypothetical protein
MPAMFLLLRRGTEPPLFTLAYFAVILAVVIGFILWDRRYRRAWQQFRARNWPQVAGKFDEGEIVTMRKGRSHAITGYQVWLGYDYEVGGEETGLYTLPFSGEFPTEEEAEKRRRLVAHRSVIVRVSPRNPKHACILDDDVRPLIATASK